MIKFLKPIFKGILQATPFPNIVNAVKDYQNKKLPEANFKYLLSFFLTLILILLLAFGKLDFETTEDLIKLID